MKPDDDSVEEAWRAVKPAALRTAAMDKRGASGIAEGDVFEQVREMLNLPKPR